MIDAISFFGWGFIAFSAGVLTGRIQKANKAWKEARDEWSAAGVRSEELTALTETLKQQKIDVRAEYERLQAQVHDHAQAAYYRGAQDMRTAMLAGVTVQPVPLH